MSTSDSFFEIAKSIQETYLGGSLNGQLFALENMRHYLKSVRETDEVRVIKSYIDKSIEETQSRIDETAMGKTLNSLTQSK